MESYSPCFPLVLLKKAAEDPLPGQLNPAPEPLLLNGKEEYLLDDILDSRRTGRRNRLQYRVAGSG